MTAQDNRLELLNFPLMRELIFIHIYLISSSKSASKVIPIVLTVMVVKPSLRI